MTTQRKAAPWYGGVLAVAMTGIALIGSTQSADAQQPPVKFDRAYATDVARGVERACREINHTFNTAVLKDAADVQRFQDTIQAQIHVHTKRMPGYIAEGYAGGAETYLSSFRTALLHLMKTEPRNAANNPELARQAAEAKCASFLVGVQSMPTVEKGGFKPPLQEGARIPKPNGW